MQDSQAAETRFVCPYLKNLLLHFFIDWLGAEKITELNQTTPLAVDDPDITEIIKQF